MQRNYSFLRSSALLCLVLFPMCLQAQEHETIDNAYMPPAATASPNVSPAYHFSGSNIFISQVNVDANGNNILNDAANEPSIGVNVKDPARMSIGWRQFDNIESNFRQAGFGYTTDGGVHWTFPGVIAPLTFHSDPVLASDADGRIYYNSLAVIDGTDFKCSVFRATGDGTWDDGVYAIGGDKAWMTIDQTEGVGKGIFIQIGPPATRIVKTTAILRDPQIKVTVMNIVLASPRKSIGEMRLLGQMAPCISVEMAVPFYGRITLKMLRKRLFGRMLPMPI